MRYDTFKPKEKDDSKDINSLESRYQHLRSYCLDIVGAHPNSARSLSEIVGIMGAVFSTDIFLEATLIIEGLREHLNLTKAADLGTSKFVDKTTTPDNHSHDVPPFTPYNHNSSSHTRVSDTHPYPLHSTLLYTEEESSFHTQIGGEHYKDLPIQPAEYVHKNKIPYLEGSVIYYVTRWRQKNGIADIDKAIHTLQLLKEMENKT